jgi:hypothetical protein
MAAPFQGWDFSFLRGRSSSVPLPWDYSRAAGPAAAESPAAEQGEGLPFRDRAFGLVTSRHESFRASEVARVPAPGGRFVTQQVDLHWADDFRAALDLPVDSRAADSWLPLARQQVRAAGLVVQRAESAAGELSFTDIGALVLLPVEGGQNQRVPGIPQPMAEKPECQYRSGSPVAVGFVQQGIVMPCCACSCVIEGSSPQSSIR